MGEYRICVLAFAPHPDDVELQCGGLLAKMASSGYPTGIVDLTRGELSSRGTVQHRAAEAQAAAQILGLTLRENLGLPDGGIEAYSVHQGKDDSTSHLAQVVACLRRLRPELVLLPHPRGRHPDHGAASILLSRAVFFAGLARFEVASPEEHFSPRQVLYYQERFAVRPSFIADTSNVFEKKMEALRAHRSQLGLDDPEHTGAATLISSSLTLPAVEARDRYYGAMIGTSYGEPFFMRNAVRLDDPLKHLRTTALDAISSEPLYFAEDI